MPKWVSPLPACFPQITLTAEFGMESDDIKNIFQSPAHFLSGTLLTPLFNMGKNISQHKAQKAAYERSVYLYEKQVLIAFKDVHDAIVHLQHERRGIQYPPETRTGGIQQQPVGPPAIYQRIHQLPRRARRTTWILRCTKSVSTRLFSASNWPLYNSTRLWAGGWQ